MQINETHRRIAQSLHRWQTGRVRPMSSDECIRHFGWTHDQETDFLIAASGRPVFPPNILDFSPHMECDGVPKLLLEVDFAPVSCREWEPCLHDLLAVGIVEPVYAGATGKFGPLASYDVPYFRLDGLPTWIDRVWTTQVRPAVKFITNANGTANWYIINGHGKQILKAADYKNYRVQFQYSLYVMVGGEHAMSFEYPWIHLTPHEHYRIAAKAYDMPGLLPLGATCAAPSEPCVGAEPNEEGAGQLEKANDGSCGTRHATQTAKAGQENEPPVPQEGWLTVTQAAELLRKDIPRLTSGAAKTRVSTAANNPDEFRTNGKKRSARRIDPVSFAAWRLKMRDKDLDQEDRQDRPLRKEERRKRG